MSNREGSIRAKLLAWIKNHDEPWTPDHGPILLNMSVATGASGGMSHMQNDVIGQAEYYPYMPPVAGEEPGEEHATPESIAAELLEMAEQEAEKIASPTRFQIESVCSNPSFPQQKHHIFMVRPEASEKVGEENFEERAHEKGLIFQQMRHNEILFKATISSLESQIESYRRTIDRLQADNERKDEKHMHAILVLEDVISQRHIRDMEIRKAEANERARDRMGDMVLPMVPLLVNKAMGTPLLATGAHPLVEGLRSVFAGITQEQLNGMLQALDGPQKLQMVELFQAVYAEKEKEDKEREAAQASKPGNDHEPDLDKRH